MGFKLLNDKINELIAYQNITFKFILTE